MRYDLRKGKCLRLKKDNLWYRFHISNFAREFITKSACDECVFVKYSQNIKGQPPLTAENIIELGAFMTMDTALEDHRVYKIMHLSCRLQYHRYVHIHGVRHNCEELLAEFEADVAKDGCIDLQAT
jgi:hypothetical protein